jgi:hypothetical protein
MSTYTEGTITTLLQLLRTALVEDSNRGRLMVVLAVGADNIEAHIPSRVATEAIAALVREELAEGDGVTDDDSFQTVGEAAASVVRRLS